jgi:hypothetical protein
MTTRCFRHMLNRMLPTALAAAALASAVMPAHAVMSPLMQDTFVMTSAPNAVHGGWGSVNVNGAAGRGLLSFDLATVLPAGTTVAQVQKASLIVFVEWMDAPGAIEAVRLTQDFNENTATAATFPAHTGVGTGKVGTLSGSVRPLTIDITDLVKAAITAGSSSLGLALLPAAATPGVAVQFGSKDGKRPAQLDITLTPPSANTFWATGTGNRSCTEICSAAKPPATAVADVSGNVCARPDGSRDRSTQYRYTIPLGQTSTWACGSWWGSSPGSQASGLESQRLAQCHCAR